MQPRVAVKNRRCEMSRVTYIVPFMEDVWRTNGGHQFSANWKKKRIHSKSGVFAAVAVVDVKASYYHS